MTKCLYDNCIVINTHLEEHDSPGNKTLPLQLFSKHLSALQHPIHYPYHFPNLSLFKQRQWLRGRVLDCQTVKRLWVNPTCHHFET